MSDLGTDPILDSAVDVRGNMNSMTSPTEADLVKLGYDVVISGELAELRNSVRLTRNAQANLIGVPSEHLRMWEDLSRGMNIDTALLIGEWFWGAKTALEQGPQIDFDAFIHDSKAAQYLGIPASLVGHVAKERGLIFEDMGVLGVFIDPKSLGRKA
jgi:hypothetical protein